MSILVSPRPKLTFGFALGSIKPTGRTGLEERAKISQSSIISESAFLGQNIRIGERVIVEGNVHIGNDCSVGDDCIIRGNSYIGEGVVLEDGVQIGPNTVVGTEGFGYVQLYSADGRDIVKHIRMPHLASVVIERGVEIGASVCIDRGMLRDTIIGSGTKIDNLVQIGHNTSIGKNCIIAAESGLGGNAKLSDEVILFGQVGVTDHVSIGKKTIVKAKSLVASSIGGTRDGRNQFSGIPAIDSIADRRSIVGARKYLPLLMKKLRRVG